MTYHVHFMIYYSKYFTYCCFNMLYLILFNQYKNIKVKKTIRWFTVGYGSDYFLASHSNFLESLLVHWQLLNVWVLEINKRCSIPEPVPYFGCNFCRMSKLYEIQHQFLCLLYLLFVGELIIYLHWSVDIFSISHSDLGYRNFLCLWAKMETFTLLPTK